MSNKSNSRYQYAKSILKKKSIHTDLNAITDIENNSGQFNFIGESADFTYNFNLGYYTFLSESIYKLTGIPANEIVFHDAIDFIVEIVVDEHFESLCKLSEKAFALCKKYQNEKELTINIEFNIRLKDHSQKRILCQFTPVQYDADLIPVITKGTYTDITHIKKSGLPFLYIMANKELVYSETADPQTVINANTLPYSRKEIHVIKLFSEGCRINEIAQTLNISISTIYTYKRNIKFKTGLDLAVIITSLKEQRVI
jgi:DNA-binding CsgD family transcriptional regulator